MASPKEKKRYSSWTAGLHFTKELLEQLTKKGVNIAYITLHVGLGTFRPVSVDKVEEHEMHSEYYQMTKEHKWVWRKRWSFWKTYV